MNVIDRIILIHQRLKNVAQDLHKLEGMISDEDRTFILETLGECAQIEIHKAIHQYVSEG